MAKMIGLNAQQKHELIYALAMARSNHNRHAAECLKEAAEAEDKQVFGDLTAEAARYEKWIDVDEELIDAIREGRLVILAGEEDA